MLFVPDIFKTKFLTLKRIFINMFFLFNRILATSVFGQCKVISIQLTKFDEFNTNLIGWSNTILFIYYR